MMTPAAPAVAANDAIPPAAVRIPDAVATIGVDPVADLRRRKLRMPLEGIVVEAMQGEFAQRRDRGSRPHEAVDLMAPKSTPVRAVEEGRIAKLFNSKAGGLTIYQWGLVPAWADSPAWPEFNSTRSVWPSAFRSAALDS